MSLVKEALNFFRDSLKTMEGIAAYNRGSEAIRISIYGPDLMVKKKSVPRGLEWGNKIFKKAFTYADGLLKYYKSRGTKVTKEDLIDSIRTEIKCGKDTAKKVADLIFKGN